MAMKKSFLPKTLGLLLGLSCLSSCKDFLDTLPESTIAPQTYYNTEAQLTAALMAVYSEMGNSDESTYSRFLSLEAPSANDEQLLRSNAAVAVSAYNFDASYANLVNCWTDLYEGINRANALLENIDKSQASPAAKEQIRAEALFLRAYYYFVLVGYWGDVPLKLSSTTSAQNVNMARTPAAEVYAQIIGDMTKAEAVLKNNTDWGNTGRISKTAAAGMLARVCLHAAGRLGDQSKYADARTWALKVMNSGLHSLNSDYSQIFKNESADVYDLRECLWEVEFNGNGVGNVYREIERFGSTLGIPNNNETVGFMQGQYVATGVQFQLYGTGDLRRDWNIAPFTYTGQDATKAQIPYAATYVWGRYIAKWRRQYQTIAFAKNFGPTNWPLLRYSDILLMFAEADNEVNGGPTTAAYLAVNQVRRRGYGLPIATASAVADTRAGQSKADFFNTLKDERARELAFEGHRKLDLLRWGNFLTVMKGMVPIINTQAPSSANSSIGYYGRAATLVPYNNVSQRDMLWPIPSTEVSLNKSIVQNPGW
jgi:hypothetical protein